MFILRIALIFMFLLDLAPVSAAAQTRELCAIAKSSLEEASLIRGLKKKREIPCVVKNQEEIKKFLLDTIRDKYPSEKLEMEELVYKSIGVIPCDFEYKKELVDFYTFQVSGFYDPEKKHFVMASWIPAMLQAPVAVHELTHALQDQYFDLEAFTDVKKYTTDELLARTALVEGDATAVMTDMTRAMVGAGPIVKEKNVDSILLQNVIGLSLVSAASSVPRSLQLMFLFPYNSGLRFAHELLKKGGYREVNEVFRYPPRSTKEILHFEKYVAQKKDFENISADSVLRNSGEDITSVAYRDSLGEFMLTALLSNYQKDTQAAARIAAGWAGDTVVVIKRNGNSKPVVYWLIKWHSAEELKEFSDAYLGVLQEIRKPGTYSFSIDETNLAVRVVFHGSVIAAATEVVKK